MGLDEDVRAMMSQAQAFLGGHLVVNAQDELTRADRLLSSVPESEQNADYQRSQRIYEAGKHRLGLEPVKERQHRESRRYQEPPVY